MKAKIAAYYLASSVTLLLISMLSPGTTSEGSLLKWIDGAAASLLPGSVSASAGSSHAAAIRVSYLAAVALSVIGAIALAMLVAGTPKPGRIENRSSIRISSRFMLVAALALAAVPFLPLLPTADLHPFRWLEEAVQQSRVLLGLWNVTFFIGYSLILFFVLLSIISHTSSQSK